MFYITDYITKMDVKTYEMLSLLSCTVASVSEDPNLSPKDNAKRLLHRCLSQFTRQQQIHAQQAVRYIRELGDSYQSHATVPMLSSALIAHVIRTYKVVAPSQEEDSDSGSDTENEHDGPSDGDATPNNLGTEEPEPSIKISLDPGGVAFDVTQVDDYWYRSDSLSHLCFYDFVRCVKKSKLQDKEISNRLGTFRRHSLLPPHPQADTHELIQHTEETNRYPSTELIPRVIGSSIPRRGSHRHALFMIAHFVPFSSQHPLFPPNRQVAVTDYFNAYPFHPTHQRIMNNWNEVHECEDERDAERLRKREAVTREHRLLQKAIVGCEDDEMIDFSNADPESAELSKSDAAMLATLTKLKEADWFARPSPSAAKPVPNSLVEAQNANSKLFDIWKKHVTEQEKAVMSARRDAVEAPTSAVRGTRSQADVQVISDATPKQSHTASDKAPETIPLSSAMSTPKSPVELLEQIGIEHALNEEQFIAYRIVAHQFLQAFDDLHKSGAKESK
ncbi:hypothetical protein FRC01_004338 [Tulasnella sp. 417]|nr:hypothetical protein FRC01_004338 [Tulasnella sp. 417]